MSFLRYGNLLRASAPWRGHLLDKLPAATRFAPERMLVRAVSAAAKEAKQVDSQAAAKVCALAAFI